MNKECAACGWDGTLTRKKCGGCGEEKWYCSDCYVGNRAFNCSECQAHSGSGEVPKKCMVCKQQVVLTFGPMSGTDIVCGECNENFEGVFNGDHPTFYGTYLKEAAEGAAHEHSAHDSQRVYFNPAEFAVVTWADVTCMCPRGETRWNTEHHN
jgi:hypothetical protein